MPCGPLSYAGADTPMRYTASVPRAQIVAKQKAAAPTGQPPFAFSALNITAEGEPCLLQFAARQRGAWRRADSYRTKSILLI